MGTHKCFGNYEPGKNCRACIEQKKCIESMSGNGKKKPGRPSKKEKAEKSVEEKPAEVETTSEAEPSDNKSEAETSESLL